MLESRRIVVYWLEYSVTVLEVVEEDMDDIHFCNRCGSKFIQRMEEMSGTVYRCENCGFSAKVSPLEKDNVVFDNWWEDNYDDNNKIIIDIEDASLHEPEEETRYQEKKES